MELAVGLVAQRQSRGLIIPWLQVRILPGPVGREGTEGRTAWNKLLRQRAGGNAAALFVPRSAIGCRIERRAQWPRSFLRSS